MMAEVVYARSSVWFPRTIRVDGELRIELAAGADANHDPRVFTFPAEETHVAVLRRDLARHLLLWAALVPLWDDAGSRGTIDEAAAGALLDPVLLSNEDGVESLFREIRWDVRTLVAHGANVALLERGRLVAALRNASEANDWGLVRAWERARSRRPG